MICEFARKFTTGRYPPLFWVSACYLCKQCCATTADPQSKLVGTEELMNTLYPRVFVCVHMCLLLTNCNPVQWFYFLLVFQMHS